MSKPTSLLLLLLVVAACASNRGVVDADHTGPAIFRYADLGSRGHIVLGEPLRQRDRLGVDAGENAYHVLGWYTGTEGITVYSDEENRVTAMRFEYGPEQDFEVQLAEYTTLLGPPDRHDRNDEVETVMWSDGATQFELVRRFEPNQESYSVLRDLETNR